MPTLLVLLRVLWNFGFCDPSFFETWTVLQVTSLAQEAAQVPEWCTGIPVLVRWVAIAVFRMAAVGFALYVH